LGHFELLVLLALRGADTNGEPAALFVPMAFSRLERQDFGDMRNNGVVARLKPRCSVHTAALLSSDGRQGMEFRVTFARHDLRSGDAVLVGQIKPGTVSVNCSRAKSAISK
jgi:hypothetical protein